MSDYRPREKSQTKPDLERGLSWIADGTMPPHLRGKTLVGGVPCFIGRIDYSEPAVLFAVPAGMKDYPVVRLTADRPGLAKLADTYRPADGSSVEEPWAPPGSPRARAIEAARTDREMPDGLRKSILSGGNWQANEDADYFIHGAN